MSKWADRFTQLDQTPWPGPRPIATDEREHLKGRDVDEQLFRTAVLDHLLVVLTADSGVGKTSLLNGRLLPNLRDDGFRTVYISEWHLDDAAGPGAFVAAEVVRQIDGLSVPVPTDDAYVEAFWSKVDSAIGERLVLVLDQFEELVRYQPSLFRRALEWLTNLNRSCRIRVIISLRAEYHHQLRQLEASARPFTMTTVRIEPLTSEGIGQVIKDPQSRDQPIADDAASTIASAWADQQDRDESPGLLHLQGLLYSLFHRTKALGGTEITLDDVSAVVDDAGGPDHLFGHGLAMAMALKVDHCATAGRDRGLDSVLVDGSDGLVRRILPSLSSGGFKLVLSEWEIARRALAAEIARSELDDEACRQLYQTVKSRFADEERALASPWEGGLDITHLTTLADGRGYEWDDWVPWRDDPEDLSSGPMLGMPQASVIEQEMRRFAFAMRWLELAAIVRRSAPTPTTTMVALIHDGFGAALERDFQQPRETFSHTVARINGAIGERLTWLAADIEAHRTSIEGAGEGPPLMLVNMRWRDCSVLGVDFEDMVFANGDFRGTRFERCSFRGVTFVNCLLDNASLIECRIVGTPELPAIETMDQLEFASKDGDRTLPDFALSVPSETTAVLATYRPHYPRGSATLYSRTSGLSVHPIADDSVVGLMWSPALGGLAMFGGRLSSLMVRGCAFLPDLGRGPSQHRGSISLRHIAGASLDLVEHVGGHIDIVDSTIRGLTVTSAVDETSTMEGAAVVTELSIAFAVLANAWFGEGLSGKADLYECIVAQLTNCNHDSFQVLWDEATDIKVGTHDDLGQLDAAFRSTPAAIDAPAKAFRAMDYRSQPARLELDRGAINLTS